MKKKQFYVLLSAIVFFIATYFFTFFYIDFFNVNNAINIWRFYFFISGVSAVMLLSLIMIYYFNNRYVGHTFIAWTMVKLMAVIVYFLIFVFGPDITLKRIVLYCIVSLYLMYLIYEVVLTVYLLKKTV